LQFEPRCEAVKPKESWLISHLSGVDISLFICIVLQYDLK
jgi:hypothetical protein